VADKRPLIPPIFMGLIMSTRMQILLFLLAVGAVVAFCLAYFPYCDERIFSLAAKAAGA